MLRCGISSRLTTANGMVRAAHQLDRRLDLDGFVDRLREGLMVGHPDMPAFRFSREEARAFVLYLRSIQAP